VLEGRDEAAHGLCDPADVHERVSIAGGATGMEPVVVGVEHDHERADEGPSGWLRIGDVEDRRPQAPFGAVARQLDGPLSGHARRVPARRPSGRATAANRR